MALNIIDGLQPITLANLVSGDQVAVKRKVELEQFHPCLKILNSVVGEHYFHHGIFVEPRYIIHQTWSFSNVTLTQACKEDIIEFLNNISVDGMIYKVVYDEKSCLPAEDVVKRAEEMVSSGQIEQFNIANNNCETFATFLKTGKRRSSQVQAVCDKVKSAVPAEMYVALRGLMNVQQDN